MVINYGTITYFKNNVFLITATKMGHLEDLTEINTGIETAQTDPPPPLSWNVAQLDGNRRSQPD